MNTGLRSAASFAGIGIDAITNLEICN